MKLNYHEQNKLKENWYTKKRTGFIFDLSQWILTSPEALSILMFMSNFFACLFIAVMLIMSILFDWGMIPNIILGVMFGASLWNFYKYLKIAKFFGIKKVFSDTNVKEMVFSKGGKK